MTLKGLSAFELSKIFNEGKSPLVASLLGPPHEIPCDWRVDMLTGPIPNLGGWPLHHRKRFQKRDNGWVEGFNLFFGNTRWGAFDVEYHVTANRSELYFNYDKLENSSIVRGFLDYVHTTEDSNLLLGKFFYIKGSRALGPYFFSLARVMSTEWILDTMLIRFTHSSKSIGETR